MAKKLYRVARDEGRQIGLDLLTVNRAGMFFTHPSFKKPGEFIFHGDKAMCRALVDAIPNCFIVDTNGKRVEK